MNDYDKAKALFSDFGIGFSEDLRDGQTHVIICEKGADKIIGYTGFVAEFYFDENGRFLRIGLWE